MILDEDESKNKDIPLVNSDSPRMHTKREEKVLLSFNDCRYFESI